MTNSRSFLPSFIPSSPRGRPGPACSDSAAGCAGVLRAGPRGRPPRQARGPPLRPRGNPRPHRVRPSPRVPVDKDPPLIGAYSFFKCRPYSQYAAAYLCGFAARRFVAWFLHCHHRALPPPLTLAWSLHPQPPGTSFGGVPRRPVACRLAPRPRPVPPPGPWVPLSIGPHGGSYRPSERECGHSFLAAGALISGGFIFPILCLIRKIANHRRGHRARSRILISSNSASNPHPFPPCLNRVESKKSIQIFPPKEFKTFQVC